MNDLRKYAPRAIKRKSTMLRGASTTFLQLKPQNENAPCVLPCSTIPQARSPRAGDANGDTPAPAAPEL
jgi:hypothetical protein